MSLYSEIPGHGETPRDFDVVAEFFEKIVRVYV